MAKVEVFAEQTCPWQIMLNVESVGLTPEQFDQLCLDNPEVYFELTAQKEIVIMSPTGGKTGMLNAEITYQLANWAKKDGRGIAFDSNAGFALLKGARRSPDASWIPKQAWNALTAEQQSAGWTPICPEFVIELWSPRDSLKQTQRKMAEYIESGCKLGFLVYPKKRQVFVYRSNHKPVLLDQPTSVSGDPELPGFTLDLTEIWK